MNEHDKVVALLEEKAKLTNTPTHPRYTLSQTDTEDYLKDLGLPKPILQKIKEADQNMNTGAYVFGSGKLVDLIKQVKADGGDPVEQDCKVEVVMKHGTGPRKLVVKAATTNKNPQSGEQIIKYGGFRLNVVMKRTFNNDAVAGMQKAIEEAMA